MTTLLLGLVFVTHLCLQVYAGSFLYDGTRRVGGGCNAVSVGDFTDLSARVVNVAPSCNKGDIEYHYTVPPLDIVFKRRGKYRVCINSRAMKDWEHFSISSMVRSKYVQLGYPSLDNKVCADNTYGNLRLRIDHDATIGPSYMFNIPYVITPVTQTETVKTEKTVTRVDKKESSSTKKSNVSTVNKKLFPHVAIISKTNKETFSKTHKKESSQFKKTESSIKQTKTITGGTQNVHHPVCCT